MPKVTIIMPVFNGGEYFKKAIKSAINQSLSDLEIIVVDSGSTDGTVEYVDKLLPIDKRIRLIKTEKKSTGYQCNIGIKEAKGDYIGFLESDDYLSPEIVKSLYIECIKFELDCVKCDFELFIGQDEEFPLWCNILKDEMANYYGRTLVPADYPQLVAMDINSWNGLYKRSFLLDNEIVQNTSPGAAFQDIGFVLQTIIKAKRVRYLNVSGYRYRQDNPKSSIYNPKTLEYIIWEAEYACSYIDGIESSIIGNYVISRFIELFLGYYEKTVVKNADKDFLFKSAERFRDICNKWCDNLDENSIDIIMSKFTLRLYALLYDIDALYSIEKEYTKMEFTKRNRYLRKANDYSKIYIFDSGRMGRCCYAMLYRNGFKNVMGFCDNDPSRVGGNVMGLPVYYPDYANKTNDNALFIVAVNEGFFSMIYNYLVGIGIRKENICKAYNVIEHTALEIGYNECKDTMC